MNIGDLRILNILGNIALRLWAVSSVTIVSCFVLYWYYGGILAFGLLVFSFLGLLYNAEDQLLYHPSLPSHSRVFVPWPSSYGLPYENLRVATKDGVLLHMFFIKQTNPDAKAPTIIFLHGNAGNMGHRLQNASGMFKNLCVNILMLDYRGYGLSEGSPSEAGFYKDAQAAVDYLYQRTDIDCSKLIVFGRSLGGAVAIDLVSRPEYANKVWSVIVENTFTSIPDMANILTGWRCLRCLPLMIYKNKFLSLDKVSKVKIPSLFICGTADKLVPPVMAEQLHIHCGSKHKMLLCVPSGGHNDTWACRGYYGALQMFIKHTPCKETFDSNDEKIADDTERLYLHGSRVIQQV